MHQQPSRSGSSAACHKCSHTNTTALPTLPGIYVDAEADPEAVVVDLEAMLQRLGGLGEALATYNQVRQVLLLVNHTHSLAPSLQAGSLL